MSMKAEDGQLWFTLTKEEHSNPRVQDILMEAVKVQYPNICISSVEYIDLVEPDDNQSEFSYCVWFESI